MLYNTKRIEPMKTLDLITLLNLICLTVNLGFGIFGITVLLKARKLNKEFENYLKSKL